MGESGLSSDEVRNGLKPLFPRLWRYCLVLTGNRDQANDLAQKTCLRALDRAEQYDAGTKLDRWVFRIAQRVWFNELRADAVRRGGGLVPAEDAGLVDHRSGPESNMFARQVLSEVMKLPEAQRSTVLLVYVEGYSYKEASDILDIPIGTVMSRLAAARSKLSGKLETEKSRTG